MLRFDGFDQFEQRIYTLLAVILMYGVPLGTVAVTFLFLPTSLSWLVKIPVFVGAYLAGFFLMFLVMGAVESSVTGIFGWVRRQTGRTPLNELERQIEAEQQEAAENVAESAQKAFAGREHGEQLYTLFLIGNDVLRYLKSIHSLLQSILLALIIFAILLLTFWIVQQYSTGAFPF